MGHRAGIDIDRDRSLLAALPDAAVTFLVEPHRSQLTDQLWNQPWDILFFAGHSETTAAQGRISINPTDHLTLEELTYGLRRAVAQGLQLAIFNSCDGLGLAHALAPLHLPHMIVMREPIPDPVAQAFLKSLPQPHPRRQAQYLDDVPELRPIPPSNGVAERRIWPAHAGHCRPAAPGPGGGNAGYPGAQPWPNASLPG